MRDRETKRNLCRIALHVCCEGESFSFAFLVLVSRFHLCFPFFAIPPGNVKHNRQGERQRRDVRWAATRMTGSNGCWSGWLRARGPTARRTASGSACAWATPGPVSSTALSASAAKVPRRRKSAGCQTTGAPWPVPRTRRSPVVATLLSTSSQRESAVRQSRRRSLPLGAWQSSLCGPSRLLWLLTRRLSSTMHFLWLTPSVACRRLPPRFLRNLFHLATSFCHHVDCPTLIYRRCWLSLDTAQL